jgi:transposase-like protein
MECRLTLVIRRAPKRFVYEDFFSHAFEQGATEMIIVLVYCPRCGKPTDKILPEYLRNPKNMFLCPACSHECTVADTRVVKTDRVSSN